ncbi:hypothetical protein [Catenulispora pinisilvae]|uniref:hypothetical protein n=1 Tax=Catenulispora pinisilvae TaxID=2705253 RepID=UPI001891B3B0|nr:hypothetical protein [Catenulispora pinisilvae]
MGDLRLSVWRLMHRYRDPVPGTLRLTAKDWNGSSVTYVGVISAPGLDPTPISRKTSEPSRRFVMTGMDLPVLVDRSRPYKFKILWKQVLTGKQYRENQRLQDLQRAHETAARMAAGDTNAGTNPMDAFFSGGTGLLGGTTFSAGTRRMFTNGGGNVDLTQAVTSAIAEAFGGHQSGAWGESNVHVQIVGDGGAPVVNGRPATAVVRAASDVTLPGFVGGMVPGGVVDMTLEVTPPDGGDRYPAQLRMAFSSPERRAQVATPGTEIPVLVDPNLPTHVVIDKDAFGAL